jgi:hypothetical protein
VLNVEGSTQTCQCGDLQQDGPSTGHAELKFQPCPGGIPGGIYHSSEDVALNVLQLSKLLIIQHLLPFKNIL